MKLPVMLIFVKILYSLASVQHYFPGFIIPQQYEHLAARRRTMLLLYENKPIYFVFQFITKKKLDENKFHLVGWAMGGTIAGFYAAQFPNDLKLLTLIAPGSKFVSVFILCFFPFLFLAFISLLSERWTPLIINE